MGAVAACDHVRQHSFGDVQVLEGEAHDQLVFVSNRNVTKDGTTTSEQIVCASPSPDAIKSDAFSVSASGSTPKASGGVALGSSESSAFVGMRTQTVQLLRDGYYRLCEAYLNGALTGEEYREVITSMPKVFSLMMAIDAVAGAAVAPAVALNSGTVATNTSGNAPAGGGTSNASVTGQSASDRIEALARAAALNEHGAKVLLEAIKYGWLASHPDGTPK
jgi:hypothetical protein